MAIDTDQSGTKTTSLGGVGDGGPGDVSLGSIWSSLKLRWGELMRRVSFWSVVAVAAILSTVYYALFSESLYVSETIISIQNKSSVSSGVGSVLGGIGVGGATMPQTTQLQEYIMSMEMLNTIDKQYHLRALYSSSSRNPFWRLWFPQQDENLLWFYQHMVEIEPQTDVGVLTVDVMDYDKVRAQGIAKAILAQSEAFMNHVSAVMQVQTMSFAQNELQKSVVAVQGAKDPVEQQVAEIRLSSAQQALAAATGEANQQQVFIVPISSPTLPTITTRPERILDIAGITLATALLYAVGFLMLSNVRDHRRM